MTKTLIIISVIVLAYAGFWYLNIQESKKAPAPDALEYTQEEYSDKPITIDDSVAPNDFEPEETPVKALDLSNKGLTQVPQNIFDRTELTELDLSENALTGALPGEIRHLKNLEKLDVSDNQMTGIPAEVGQLSKLKVLDYSNNGITGMPNEIRNLSNLEVFYLTGNDYSEHDLGIILEALPNLKVITD